MIAPVASLVIHQAALGDSLLTLPLLDRLMQDGPLRLVMPSSKARLIQRLRPAIVPLDIEHRFWTSLHSDHPSALDWPLPQADGPIRRIVSFVSDGQDRWAANIRKWMPDAEHYFISPNPPATWNGHVTDWHRHQLPCGWRSAGDPLATGQSPDASLHPIDPHGVILIHPGSGGQAKCWPIERYEPLIHRLMRNRLSVKVIFGQAEECRLRHRALPCESQFLTDLDSLADAIASANFFIGNDSGPTHLAAQMGLATLALFGPSRCDHWHPIGPQTAWLCPPEPRPMDWLSVDRVYDTIMDRFFSNPCGLG